MRWLLFLSGKSAWNRRGTLLPIVLSIAVSIVLLLGVEKIRTQVRDSFLQAVHGTDLIVGARGGDVQLMLYAVFHLGSATHNMGWDSAKAIAAKENIAWSVPVSLGDSHRGHPVVATTPSFFSDYRVRRDKPLIFAAGRKFNDLFEVVIGSEVAKKQGYTAGKKIVLSHGSSGDNLPEHSDKPFVVSGVLSATGTPVDRSLYISLEAMEAIHLDWQGGAVMPGLNITSSQVTKFNLEPKSITALLVGLKKRTRVFALQREVNAWKHEPLMAIIPGVVIDQIWYLAGTGEQALLLISLLVTLASLAGLISVMLAGLGERRRELAILRSAGASLGDIVLLLLFEGIWLTVIGVLGGSFVFQLLLTCLGPTLLDSYGIMLELSLPGAGEWILLGCVGVAGVLSSLVPAIHAYRMSLADGLSVST
ncbi:MAG: ABC transporter permease [Burkholderiaceae bacterium]|nr:ABC transporter permease [Burkholderiaceae bacterium]